MIFLFDKFKQLKGTVRNRHTISLLYERERNGLYTVSAEIPLKITDKKTVYNYHKKVKDSDFLGHYDREGRFQLHKIASVDIEDSSIFIKGVHLFFDEAKAGAIIQERRFRGSEIIDGARVAFDSIGWSVVDFDISDTKDYIFYNVSPLEARAILVETFGYEFDYWLDFDGKNIRNKQISVKREMGKDSNKRYNYGHNVLNIKVEQDYSEIYTAVIGRGKGEDLGDDAYGRRIEYTDVVWKTPNNPMNKPKGSRTLHDENATQLFGYHEDGKVSPRTKVEIFEDIEDPAELLQASYEWLRENSVPKAVFSLEVPDGDGLDLGDKVHVIYRDIDLVKHTRVTRVVDDLVSGNRDVEFGDTAYFKTDRRLSGVKSELKRVNGSVSNRITRLKEEFDKRFDDEVQQWKDDFEQSVIDAEAAVEVMRAEMTEEFEAVQRVMTEEFNQSVADAKKHAEDEAEAKAAQVQSNLDSFSAEHSKLISEVQSDVQGVSDSILGINNSLSDIEGTLTNTKTQLENQVSDARTELEQSISNTRTELEGKIDTAEEALNKVGEDLGVAKTDLQKQLDDARAELEGLEVGGRNLLADSNISVTNSKYLLNSYDLTDYIEEGEEVTLTIKGQFAEDTNSIMLYNSGGAVNMTRFFLTSSKVSDEIYQHTFRWMNIHSSGAVGNSTFISFYKQPANSSNENTVEWATLVRGNKSSLDWTPAPEDSEQKITNINQTITNIEGELSTKVEQTEVDALKGTVTQQGTLLTQTANEVSSKAEKSVVDTLTGRVSNAESSVTQNANEIAKKLTKSVYDSDKKATDAKITQWSNTATETAEGLSRVIGRVSQTEKGVETAQTRIEAEAGRIDGVLSRTSKVEGQVQDAQLAIEANADGLALRATKTEVEQAIDGIEVGGRNLLRGTSDEWREEKMGTAWYRQYFFKDTILEVGETYTFSYLVEKTSEDSVPINVSLGIGTTSYQYDMPGTHYYNVAMGTKNSITFTFTQAMADRGLENRFAFRFRNEQKPTSIRFKEIQLEKGNKATDWTPAPEDIDASISGVTDRVTTAEAELVVQAGEISQKASQSELNRVTGRVSTAETSITQNANEIARRLVKSDYDSDKAKTDGEITKWSNLTSETAEGLKQTISRVSTAEGKLSNAELNIKANADSLKLTATKTEVENAIDGIEVGGRNLLLDSGEPNALYFHTNNGATSPIESGIEDGINWVTGRLASSGNFYLSLYNNPTFEGGYNSTYSEPLHEYDGELTYSVDVMSTEPVVISLFGGELVKLTPNKWTRLHRTNNSRTRTPGMAAPEQPDIPLGTKVYWRKYKIEKGTKATDWTPAPEDIDASISEVTDRVTTAEAEIVVQAGEISQKASQSELDRVAGRVSTAETSIKQNSDSLKLTATKTEVGNAIDGIKVGGRNLLLNSNVQYETDRYNIADYPLSEAIVEGTELTISIKGQLNSKKSYFGVYNSGGSVQTASLRPDSQNSDGVYVGTFKWRAGSTSNTFLRVYQMPNSVTGAVSKIDWVKLEYGNKATDWTPAPEDTDAKINDISKDYVKQSSVKVTPDRVTIGSTVVNGSTIGSVLSVSPTGIDAVADAMRLSGDLLVAGDVTALAVNAVEGNFSRLFSKSLTTNVIKASHIQTDTALAKKLFATNANIDELVTKTHFSNSIKTISIEAAKANFASATASWFGANVIESSWLNVDTALFNRFTSSTAFINSLTAKNAFISNIKAIDIDLNRATITGGDGTNYIRMNNQNVMSYGTFTRSWGGETDSAKLELGIFDGQIRARNLDTGYRLYLTERGLSTSMAGAIDEFTSGTLEFHSQRFNRNSRGVTMHSSYGAVAMVSDYSTAYIRSQLTANIESEMYSVYIRPFKDTRNGLNEFQFYVKANTSPQDTDGALLFGDLTGDNSSGSGIRFSKRRNVNTLYVTNINGDIGTGNISVQDAEIRGHIRTANRIDFQQWSDRSQYNQIGVGAVNTYNSLILASHTNGNAYIGVGYNELRITNNNGYNGGDTGYRPIRVHKLHTTSSYAFENHSGGDVYFGTGSGGLRVTNNNHYNGGNIGWRDIEFRNWKANSHERYKKDIKEWDLNVLDIFKDELQLYQYKYSDDLENNMLHRGIVLREDSTHDKFPSEWRQDDGFNGNEVMWWNTKAIQELALENDSLKSEVAELKTQLNKIMEMIE